MEILELLSKNGVSLDDMVNAGFALYVGDNSEERISALKLEFKERLKKNMNDPNIGLLIAAAIHLDQVIKGESSGIFSSSEDPESLVADELIGMSISEYIAGKKGLFNYVRYDKEKPGILADLPPFLDDAIGALIAATMTRLFEE